MKYGERVRMTVEWMDEKGRGVGPILNESSTSNVIRQKHGVTKGVIPGETVEASFVGKDKGKLRLSDAVVITASPDRIKEECPHAGICGGCSLQHVRYGRQLKLKEEEVNRAFEEAGLALRVSETASAAQTFRHRNRMDYVFGRNGELGLKESGRWDRTVDLSTCLMLSEEANEVRLRVRAWARATGKPYWDVARHEGYFRYLVIREGKATGERMATLVTADGPLPDGGGLVAQLKDLCTTVYHGVNPLVTDLSIARNLALLHGKPELTERVGGIAFAIHPNSFFQTNTSQAEVLMQRVRELVMAGPHDRLLDLYCGSGFFSLGLSRDVRSALGIELDADAIANAKRNAEMNGIGNVDYRAEAAETLSWSAEKPDVVIVDPPRSGLHPKVKRTLLQHLPPRIVYVSCKPQALALDLKELLTAYEAEPPVAIDLFPQTAHIETLVHLTRKKT